jgi:hypothetical protein
MAIIMIIATTYKNRCKVLLQCYYLQPFLTKVTFLLLKGITTNMAILQSYFTVAIDQFSSSAVAVTERTRISMLLEASVPYGVSHL